MIHILGPSTVLNPSALETKRVPKRILGRPGVILPRRSVLGAFFWRYVLEHQFLRYMTALLPFLLALAIWPDLALPISQAPLLMFLLIWLAESRLLSVQDKEARAALIDPAEADRGLDLLAARARRLLSRIAAGRGMTEGALHLVVEQSELARVPPLTFVSVQREGPEPGLLDLDAEEARQIAETLFDADLTERRLHTINLSQNDFLRDIRMEARAVSSHARLAALAASR